MKMKQVIGVVLALSFMGGSIHAPIAQAALVGTDEIILSTTQQQQVSEARDHIQVMLARDEVSAQLAQMGVDPELIVSRVDSLTDAEVLQLAAQMDELPAGGSILGAAVFIFLVLLVTDILGFTDVFPFVNR